MSTAQHQPRTKNSGMVADGLSLSASAVIGAAAGMIGWVLAARLLPPADVGHTSAFVSGFLLVAGFADLGLGSAVLRWLPRAGGHRRTMMRRGYLAVATAALIGSVIFLLVPAGRAVVAGIPGGAWLFVLGGVGWTLFQFQHSVLTGLRLARWVPVENTAFAAARLGLLAGLAVALGSMGLILSWVVPALLCVLVVSALLVWRAGAAPMAAPGALPRKREVLRLLGPTYPAAVCQVLLYNLLPLIVLHRFGAAANAVFFVSWSAINALDFAAVSFVNPMVVRLAESAGERAAVVRQAAGKLLLVFGPVLLAGAALAGTALGVFGPEYRSGTGLLQLLLLAQLPRLVVVLGIGTHLAEGRGFAVAGLHAVTAVLAVSLALFVPAPIGFGIGMLAGQCLLAALVAVDLRRRIGRRVESR